MKEYISGYINRGFGSMNKNDFEVFIFDWLLKNDKRCTDSTDFMISQYLKIPESKVKRLRYEAQLKYGVSYDYKEELCKALKNAKCQEGTNEGKISFAISDKVLKQYLEDILEKDGRFFDSSFNANIVTMSANDFVYILQEVVLNENDKDMILNATKEQLKKGKELPKTVSERIKDIGVKLNKIVLEKIAGAGAGELVKTIIDICTKNV